MTRMAVVILSPEYEGPLGTTASKRHVSLFRSLRHVCTYVDILLPHEAQRANAPEAHERKTGTRAADKTKLQT
jgi:hypothetical protein